MTLKKYKKLVNRQNNMRKDWMRQMEEARKHSLQFADASIASPFTR